MTRRVRTFDAWGIVPPNARRDGTFDVLVPTLAATRAGAWKAMADAYALLGKRRPPRAYYREGYRAVRVVVHGLHAACRA